MNHEGNLDTGMYRKPQKELWTLHAKSHPLSVKEYTIVNMYQLADSVPLKNLKNLKNKLKEQT